MTTFLLLLMYFFGQYFELYFKYFFAQVSKLLLDHTFRVLFTPLAIMLLLQGVGRKSKSNQIVHYTRCITPKRVTS